MGSNEGPLRMGQTTTSKDGGTTHSLKEELTTARTHITSQEALISHEKIGWIGVKGDF